MAAGLCKARRRTQCAGASQRGDTAWAAAARRHLLRKGGLAGGVRGLGPQPPGLTVPRTRLGVTLPSSLLDSPGGFQRNEEIVLCARDSLPSKVRDNRALQNFGLFWTTPLRARLPEPVSAVAPPTPVVHRRLAATGPHSEGPSRRWGPSNANPLWSAAGWACFMVLLPLERSPAS